MAMTAAEVSALVESERNGQWDRSNLHGIVLRECVVSPQMIAFRDVSNEKNVCAWVVLHECPPSGPGYAVVYEESSGKIGLAQFTQDYQPCMIGLYGDFFSTLEAM